MFFSNIYTGPGWTTVIQQFSSTLYTWIAKLQEDGTVYHFDMEPMQVKHNPCMQVATYAMWIPWCMPNLKAAVLVQAFRFRQAGSDLVLKLMSSSCSAAPTMPSHDSWDRLVPLLICSSLMPYCHDEREEQAALPPSLLCRLLIPLSHQDYDVMMRIDKKNQRSIWYSNKKITALVIAFLLSPIQWGKKTIKVSETESNSSSLSFCRMIHPASSWLF